MGLYGPYKNAKRRFPADLDLNYHPSQVENEITFASLFMVDPDDVQIINNLRRMGLYETACIRWFVLNDTEIAKKARGYLTERYHTNIYGITPGEDDDQ